MGVRSDLQVLRKELQWIRHCLHIIEDKGGYDYAYYQRRYREVVVELNRVKKQIKDKCS